MFNYQPFAYTDPFARKLAIGGLKHRPLLALLAIIIFFFQVYETTGLSSTKLSEVFLLIPDANVTTETNMLEDMEFSSDARVSHGHEGVGSGKVINL